VDDFVVEYLLLSQLLLLYDYMVLVFSCILVLLHIAHVNELMGVDHWHLLDWYSLDQIGVKVREFVVLDALVLTRLILLHSQASQVVLEHQRVVTVIQVHFTSLVGIHLEYSVRVVDGA
jgi:hypothetical protein